MGTFSEKLFAKIVQNPVWNHLFKFQILSQQTANRMAPLGLLSMAAYLEREGDEVFVHDCLGPKAPGSNEINAKSY
jgi:hypothetical protein